MRSGFWTGGVMLGLGWASAAVAQPLKLPEIVVEGSAAAAPVHELNLDMESVPTGDLSRQFEKVPGLNLTSNGPVTGEIQRRGQFGNRIAGSLNGVPLLSAGPNRMDPPAHYAPPGLVRRIRSAESVAPVSAGIETLGGQVDFDLVESEFGAGPAWQRSGLLSLGGRHINESGQVSGLAALANDRHRLHASFSEERADDTESDDGDINPTEYERSQYGIGYGMRAGLWEGSWDYRHQNTDDAGTPALPMDIRKFDADFLNTRQQWRIGAGELNAHLTGSLIDHAMDNFSLRQNLDPSRHRRADADAASLGLRLDYSLPLWGGSIRQGIESRYQNHEMKITNPNNAMFFVDNFDDAKKTQTSGFVEWESKPAADFRIQTGLRVTHTRTEAGSVDLAAGMPQPAQNLKDRFNAEDRTRNDLTVDLVLRFDYALTQTLTPFVALGRKNRTPDYFERYAWLPIEVSGGLADGNNYIGRADLRPETSYQTEAGFSWDGKGGSFQVIGFYHFVDDYIQGTPVDDTPGTVDSDAERVSAVNGDTTPLQFSNVEAKLYGVEVSGAWRLAGYWHLEGGVNYTRGKRDDIDDDLFRIAPLNGRLTLAYRQPVWGGELTWEGYAEQDNVAETLDETDTGGYGLAHIAGYWRPLEGFEVSGGMDNLFDRSYASHLAGTNRVIDSDVRLGEKVPGEGRAFYLAARYRF